MKDLHGKCAYITGGSSGIGLAVAKLLSGMGAHVAIFARDPEKLGKARTEIEHERRFPDQRFAAWVLDVTGNDEVIQTMKSIVNDFGSPDVLVSNAGISYPNYFDRLSADHFDEVIRTNLYGTRNVIAALLPHMKQRGGSIVIVSSLAGLLGIFGYTAYSASKFALVGFAECLRSELKRYHIAVSVVCPPEVDTPLVDKEKETIPPETRLLKNLGGLLQPRTAAEAVVKAIRKKKFLIVPGLMAKFFYYSRRFMPLRLVSLIQDAVVGIAARRGRP